MNEMVFHNPLTADKNRNLKIRRRGASLILLGVLLLPVLSGCGPAVKPEEVICESGTCWDASRTTVLRVNDPPSAIYLPPDEVDGWRFPVTAGHSYTVKVKTTTGTCHTYVSPVYLIDPSHTALVDYYSNDSLTFAAESGKEEYYIAVQDTGSGCAYSVRIYSYDENLESLTETVPLLENDDPVLFKLVPGETIRFMFSGTRGQDYTVRVQLLQGRTDTYLSRIPSVDQDVYEMQDVYSNDDIRFRATETGAYYIGVVDQGSPTGSDVMVQVTSP
ncbi:MAG: hypothetical protein HY204_04620 [Nitrospirae bacterium]|nr:hypothetical protein [Nitrospirota bacterium]